MPKRIARNCQEFRVQANSKGREGALAQDLAGDCASLGHHRGALVSMVAAEAEDVAGFVAESLSVPLLQGGTIIGVLAYLIGSSH